MPVIVHASWDYALLSQAAGHNRKIHSIVLVPVLTILILILVTAVRKPVRTTNASATAAAPASSG